MQSPRLTGTIPAAVSQDYCCRRGPLSPQQSVAHDQNRESKSAPVEPEVVLKKSLKQDVQDYHRVEHSIPQVNKGVTTSGQERSAKNRRGHQPRHQNPSSTQ